MKTERDEILFRCFVRYVTMIDAGHSVITILHQIRKDECLQTEFERMHMSFRVGSYYSSLGLENSIPFGGEN